MSNTPNKIVDMVTAENIGAAKNEVVSNLIDKAKELQSLSLVEKTVTINLSAIPPFQNTPNIKGEKTYYRKGLESLGIYNDIICDPRGAAYYFHLPPSICKEDIVGAIKKCRAIRSVPSIHNLHKRDNYQVLYIGSMKSHFFTRFYQHLGYGTPKTAALNLMHWAKDIFNEIKMTYYHIPHSHLALHTLMEVALCKAVIPMIGRMEKDIIKR